MMRYRDHYFREKAEHSARLTEEGKPWDADENDSRAQSLERVANKSSLSPARGRLLGICQDINFGRIENLAIRDGEPVLGPPALILRETKFGGEMSPRTECGAADFCLKKQHVNLFAFFDELQNGVIDVLEVQHGLPFRATSKEGNA